MFDRGHWHERNRHSNLGWKGPITADREGGNGYKAQDFSLHKPQAGDLIALGVLCMDSSPEYGGTLAKKSTVL